MDRLRQDLRRDCAVSRALKGNRSISSQKRLQEAECDQQNACCGHRLGLQAHSRYTVTGVGGIVAGPAWFVAVEKRSSWAKALGTWVRALAAGIPIFGE